MQANLGRVMGTKWYTGTDITGTSAEPVIFPTSGITSAFTGDCYLNTNNGNVYQCVTAGDANEAEWVFIANIRGPVADIVDNLVTDSSVKALSARQGKVLNEKLLSSGVYAKSIDLDLEQKVYIAEVVVRNVDGIISFTSADDSGSYSFTKVGTLEQYTVSVDIGTDIGFDGEGAILTNITFTDNIYSIKLKDIEGDIIYQKNLMAWTEINNALKMLSPAGYISDGSDTLLAGKLSKDIEGTREDIYPISHAKAIYYDKEHGKTVYDVVGATLKVTFDSVFAGKTYTITDGTTTYTGTVPLSSPYTIEQSTTALGTTFVVSCEAHNTTYQTNIVVGDYYGQYIATLEAFSATLTITADIQGASVPDDTLITVTNGTYTYTGTTSSSGDIDILIYHPGTYTVYMTNGTDTSPSASVVIDTNAGAYSTALSYFSATLNVTVIGGSGATVTATDGTNTYTATASGSTASLVIYVSGTYTIKATKNGEDGVITDTKAITTQGSTYTATVGFISTILNNNDWSVIKTISNMGLASNYWSVGDRKAVVLSGTVGTLAVSGTYYVFIIGFNHNSSVEGTGISFQGFKTDLTGGKDIALCDSYYGSYQKYDGTKYFQMNHWGNSNNYNTNYGGWSACDMRYDILGSTNQAPTPYGSQKTTGATGKNATSTCATSPVSNTLMAALPSALRSVMKAITKYTDNKGNLSNTQANVTSTTDYLPLPSEYEIQGQRIYANQYEANKQAQYTYYANGNSKVKYKHSATSTAAIWWVRSPYYNGATSFCRVAANGSANDTNASISVGLAPVFLV